jgi:tRNA(fMet)-specific endonuclease VapC
VKYLLDTDHISILQDGAGPEYAVLSLRISKHSWSEVVLSVVSVHEQMLGDHNYINRARTDAGVTRGYSLISTILNSYANAPVLPFDASALAVFNSLKAAKTRLATMDLRLATLALSRKLIVVTRNSKDFGKVPGLVIEDWTV